MPSDARKKRDAKKKDVAKARQQQRTTKETINNSANDDEVDEITNGINGCEVSEGGKATTTVAATAKAATEASGDSKDSDAKAQGELARQLEKVEELNSQARSCTGVLVSHERSRDIKIDAATLTFFGQELLVDSKIEFNCGNRYGLIGLNGSGKSSLFNALKNKEFPIPQNLDIFLLAREQPASDKTALEAVIDVDEERLLLETQAEDLAQYGDDDEAHEKLMDIYERLDEMGSDMAETKAAQILHGLGFTKEMQAKPCKDFSGGWRMRIALSRALYLRPSLLLLDEPTNHLDLDACVWLEEELKTYKRILVVISHSQDFMNTVCTNIIHLTQQKLNYYGGNYDTFVRTRIEQMENQMKRYNWEQSQIAHMKDYIARFGHGSAKLARQAQSKEKTLSKMVQGGLTEKATTENVKAFHFLDPGYVPPPVIMVQHVAFRYKPGAPLIYRDLDFGVDLDTRVALVGPNGAGKSTLLNLISGELMPSDGLIRRHSHVKIGRYHQHLHEQLDLNLSALEYMAHCFPDVVEKESLRKLVGRYGLTGRQQTCPMKQLSDGQRCRVSFAWLAYQSPHILLLDEPTNHLDIESIDALAEAINEFEGGIILVSHDFRLIKQVAEIIWICEHEKISVFDGDIFDYKEKLRSRIERRRRKMASSLITGKNK